MQKLAIFCVLIAGVVGFNLAHAKKMDKGTCTQVLQAGSYNDLLEQVCGFDGGVADNFKALYMHGQCNDVLTEKEVQELQQFSIQKGGVEYATKKMYEYRDKAIRQLQHFATSATKNAVMEYATYVIERNK